MRLLINAAFNTRLKVGIAIYIQRIIPELARLCDLTILTPDPEMFAPYGRTIRLPEFVRFNLRRTRWMITQMAKFCTRDYDILFSPTPVVPLPVRLPTIVVVHDLIPIKLRYLLPFKEKVAFWLGLQTLRFASVAITDSCYTRRDLIKMNLLPRERIVVAWNGPGIIPTEEEIDFARQFTPYILYVGSHAPYKNTARLVAAFARLRNYPELKLVLVGGDGKKQIDYITGAIRRHRLESKAIVLTDLNPARLSSLYRHCELFVLPSTYEGFGLPVLEAMLHGAPVACSYAASIPEVGGDAAVYFNPYSTADIAQKINYLLQQPELRKTLSKKGLKRASQFSWSKTAQTILTCAEKIC